MRGLAAEKPTIWIVDDLHFASRVGRDLALSLSRAAEGHAVLLVYTARPGVPEEELAHFERLENFQRTSLARLGGREIIELLEDAFKSELVAEKLGGRITKKSDGVPFFVFEMIRGLKEGQFIKEQADGSYVQTKVVEDIEVPSAVKDLIEGRLRGLSEEQRAILDVGAVQGMSFEPTMVAAVLEEKKVRVLRQIAEIERRFGLVRGEATACAFDQNQIQEVLYQDLLPELRAEYHTLLAEAHAARCEGEPSREDSVFLASHHLRGSRPKEGLPHLTPALDHLAKSYGNEAAIELAARSLEVPGLLEGKERIEVLLKKAGRHELRGERESQRAALDEALAMADASADAASRAGVQVAMGRLLIALADHDAARTILEQALDLAREIGDRAGEARATGNLGIVFLRQGDYGRARAQFEMHLALAREIGERAGEAKATGNLGIVFWRQGDYGRARAQFEIGLALAREIGERAGEARATGNLGNVFWSQGRYEQARAQFEELLGVARELGDRLGEVDATRNLGLVFWHQGRFEQARTLTENALALAREIGHRAGQAGATGNLGLVFWSQGDYGRARAQYEEWLALAREIGDRAGQAGAIGNLGLVFLSLGDHGRARAHLEEWLALAREIGERRAEGYALDSLAELTETEGDAEEALRLYGETLALRREMSQKDTIAETLVALGGTRLARGDANQARADLDEALALAREVQQPGTILLATVCRARLAGGDIDGALAALAEHEERVRHETRTKARFHLWELTEDKTHLEEAKRLLDFAVEHSPEEYRTSILENVPLHRDIMRAWEEHGGG
jgi:tetratricopeptide (TPR) repeat protein